MKERNYIYSVETDITLIELNLTNAGVEIYGNADGRFYAEYPNTKNIYAANDENGIIIHQGKCGIFIKPYQNIKIFVPAHTVPSVKISGKKVNVYLKSGIYGDFMFNAEEGDVSLIDCVTQSAEISGGAINFHIADSTVKNGLLIQTDRGDTLAENSFFTRAEGRIKRGNIGAVNLTCKDCAFDTQKGNIMASLVGSEGNYDISLLTREGMSNRENAINGDAEFRFHAYTKKGNIVLDFIDGQAGAELKFETENTEAAELPADEREKETV